MHWAVIFSLDEAAGWLDEETKTTRHFNNHHQLDITTGGRRRTHSFFERVGSTIGSQHRPFGASRRENGIKKGCKNQI
ncbi:hypothetical protein PGT21_031570 [Puccinia graminis f. sp. tritici]|uniref:Uncharacterized protein n=1 Tax=Puccinia graminis f. sp. tritici TaxID=56615 RepID=A0A5B0Q7U2_PUCGR|nr:hypothetical protein PGT21_031570 [Puccinia graminis f. sp. tritici]KAA1109288.1 hypothetical protein PGTUg99_026074 [Puccinia graminis f. sp. tritici]